LKRSEIKVGGEYYYDRQQDWMVGKYGTGSKAVLVDDQRYSISKTWHREHRYSRDPKGTAVLVDVYGLNYDGTEKVERTAVPVAHLRGPWGQTKAEVDARIAAKKERDDNARSARNAEAANAAIARASALGLTVRREGGYTSPRAAVAMSPEVLEILLDAYEKNAAKEG